MNKNLSYSLDRADELHRELMAEYRASLDSKTVTTRAEHLTHEVCAQLRGILDRTARLYWERKISPDLSQEDRDAVAVYFPVTPSQNGFDSTLGRWRWKTVKHDHQALYDYLLDLQPFKSDANKWLQTLTELANAGKHIDLIPQKRVDERRVTVTGAGGGSVTWGAGVTFGSGVRIMGAPVDPKTQRIMPTAGVSEKIEVWHSFVIDGYGVNAAGFSEHAFSNVRKIVAGMTTEFNLA